MDASSNSKTATLTVGNKTYNFPILSGTVGPDVVDIRKLYAQTGHVHLRPRLHGDGGCRSRITYIDGDDGDLDIAAIRSRSWPSRRLPRDLLPPAQRRIADPGAKRSSTIRHPPHDGARADRTLLPRLPPRRPSDGGMVAAVGALAAFYHNSTDINDP